jgi:hypothetical protein
VLHPWQSPRHPSPTASAAAKVSISPPRSSFPAAARTVPPPEATLHLSDDSRKHESPTCYGRHQPLPLDLVRPFLSVNELGNFLRSQREFGTIDRLYCSSMGCPNFLGQWKRRRGQSAARSAASQLVRLVVLLGWAFVIYFSCIVAQGVLTRLLPRLQHEFRACARSMRMNLKRSRKLSWHDGSNFKARAAHRCPSCGRVVVQLGGCQFM